MICNKCHCRYEDRDDLRVKRHQSFLTHAWFTYPVSDQQARGYKPMRGPYANFSDTQSDVQIFQWFEFKDPWSSKIVTARVHKEVWVWYRGPKNIHWLTKWIPGCKFTRRTMEIQFEEEVGKRAGSWKGGCVMVGYDMKPNETLSDCWYRMVNDKAFLDRL